MQLCNTIANIEKSSNNSIEITKILNFMALKDYITGLSTETTTERKIMIRKISESCGVSINAVYRWINGSSKPDKLKMQRLSEITGIPAEKLFQQDVQGTGHCRN